jgi:hypothetical protein
MSNHPQRIRTWGFRFSATDAVVVVLAGAAMVVLKRMETPLWWVLGMVFGHFFLFCNVFRIRRSFELMWSVLFILNMGVWMWRLDLSGARVLLWQLPITLALVGVEMRSWRYHGIFARRLNRRLDEYLSD